MIDHENPPPEQGGPAAYGYLFVLLLGLYAVYLLRPAWEWLATL